MHQQQHANWLARRRFLVGGAAAMTALPELAWAQLGGLENLFLKVKLSPQIADFVTGFDLKQAPPLAIERARTAFVDTVGVTLAGSTEKPAEIIRDMVREEGA